MLLDGMTNDGAGDYSKAFWRNAVTRYNVHYTRDVVEWYQLKGKVSDDGSFILHHTITSFVRYDVL